MSADGAPLQANIKLPPQFLEAIGAYKQAIREIKKDLKDVDKQAKETLKNGGFVDAVVSRQQVALRSAMAGLEDKMEAQKAAGQAQAEAAVGQRRMAFLQQHLQNLGMGSSAAARVIGTGQTIANLPGDLGGMARSIGAERIAAPLLAAGSSISAFMARHASALGVAGIAAAATSQVIGYMEESAENQRLAGEAESEAAAVVQEAVNRSVSGSSTPERILSEIRAAEAQGTGRAPIGWMDQIRVALGEQVAGQTEAVRERVAYIRKVEEARRQFGRSYDPFGNRMTKRRAWRAQEREWASPQYYVDLASATARGISMEDFNQERLTRHLMAAGGKEIEAEKARRVTEQHGWNNGVRGELNRVFEHENRRHLRTVQADGIARWNSWGMQ
jgi:hypothetical protein